MYLLWEEGLRVVLVTVEPADINILVAKKKRCSVRENFKTMSKFRFKYGLSARTLFFMQALHFIFHLLDIFFDYARVKFPYASSLNNLNINNAATKLLIQCHAVSNYR